MNLQWTPISIPLIILGGFCFFAAISIYKRHSSEKVEWLTWLLISGGFWTFSTAAEVLFASLPAKNFWMEMQFISVLSIPTILLIMTLEMTRLLKNLKFFFYPLLFSISIFSIILILTNPIHQFFWSYTYPTPPIENIHLVKSYNTGSIVFQAYLFILFGLSSALLIVKSKFSKISNNLALRGILGTALYPAVVSLLYFFFPDEINTIPITGTIFAVSMLLMAINYRYLSNHDRSFLSQKAVLSNLDDAVFFTDNDFRILEVNPAAQNLSECTSSEIYMKPLQQVVPEIDDQTLRNNSENFIPTSFQTAISRDNTLYPYEGLSIPVHNTFGDSLGQVIFLGSHSQNGFTEQRLKNAAAELHHLQKTTESLLDLRSLSDMMNDVCKNLVTDFGYQTAFIGRYDPNSETLNGLAAFPSTFNTLTQWMDLDGLTDISRIRLNFQRGAHPASDQILDGKIIFSNHPEDLLIPAKKLETARYFWDFVETGCGINLPMRAGGKTVGALLITAKAQTITQEQIQVLMRIANQTAVTLENFRLHEVEQLRSEELLREKTFLDALNQAAVQFSKTFDIQKILEILGEQLTSLGLYCLVTLREADAKVFTIRYTSIKAKQIDAVKKQINTESRTLSFPEEMVTGLLKKQKSLSLPEILDITHSTAGWIPQRSIDRAVYLFGLSESSAFILLPLSDIGAMLVWGKNLDEDNVISLNSFANQLAAVIENAYLYQQAQQEIKERQQAQIALQKSEEKYRRLVENAGEGILLISNTGTILELNPKAEEIIGIQRDLLIQHSFSELLPQFSSKTLPTSRSVQEYLLENSGGISSEWSFTQPNGNRLTLLAHNSPIQSDDEITNFVMILQDITNQKLAEEQLRHDALHDSLTGLPNRTLFVDRLESAMNRKKRRSNYLFAVLFFDLDRFKNINDTRGHTTGDLLLKELARRLNSSILEVDTVARIGGDEFAILLEDIEEVYNISLVMERIYKNLEKPFDLDGFEITISASIGVVLSEISYEDPENYLRDADIAMYRAKSSGRARFEIFDPKMRTEIMQHVSLEADLRKAIEGCQFSLYYQPIVNLKDLRLKGFEALIRWNHPQNGIITPSEFIPLAEETGLIIPIGRWALKEACQQIQQWTKFYEPPTPLTISVNLSGKQLNDPNLLPYIQSLLLENHMNPACLNLEVTESVLIEDYEDALQTLSSLKSIGIQLSLDDFGTGYSSLSYLQRFPVDVIKIDRSFVQKLGANPEDSLIKTIVLMGHQLGKSLVAEGIENLEQQQAINSLGCECGQGFLFARPLSSIQADAFLKSQRKAIWNYLPGLFKPVD